MGRLKDKVAVTCAHIEYNDKKDPSDGLTDEVCYLSSSDIIAGGVGS